VSVSCNTDRHTASSIQNILLQVPQQAAVKATIQPADRTVLDRLTSYILCTFLFQDTSCVILSISFYKHPYITPLTRSVTNQFHYQSSHCKAEPQSLLCCPSHPINILMSLLSHDQLPINSITNHQTKAEPQSLLCCPSQPINILMSHLSHDQLPINSITNHHTVKLNPNHC
jgi:hypothetical protein